MQKFFIFNCLVELNSCNFLVYFFLLLRPFTSFLLRVVICFLLIFHFCSYLLFYYFSFVFTTLNSNAFQGTLQETYNRHTNLKNSTLIPSTCTIAIIAPYFKNLGIVPIILIVVNLLILLFFADNCMLCTVQSFVFKIVTCVYINLAVKKLYTHFEHISHSWIVNKLLIQIQFFCTWNF